MTTNEIKAIQAEIGTVPDGIWGAKSKAACRDYLLSLREITHWPDADDASMRRFFGAPGDEAALVPLDVSELDVRYDGTRVKTIRCHRKVASSLRAALEEIYSGPEAKILRSYAGCYNNRPMRGAKRASKHAWGVAIDLSILRNGYSTPWPSIATMPFVVIKAFARQGWVGLSWTKGSDAMHFQATQP